MNETTEFTRRPPEGAIRFTTPNPWDDPLFRSAIKGSEREQRRAYWRKPWRREPRGVNRVRAMAWAGGGV